MKKILIIEDSQTVLDNMSKMLKAEGFWVVTAEDGEVGLELAKKHLPNLIICDVMMPKLDGFAVLTSLRQDPTTATIPFVFLTARSFKDDIRQGMTLGSDDYLTKPFTRDELIAAIQAQLKKQETISNFFRQKLDGLRNNIAQSLPHQLLFPAIQIIGLSDILVQNSHAMEPHEIPEVAKRIGKAGKDLHDMIKKFLMYAEIETIDLTSEQGQQLRKAKTTFAEIEISNLAKEIAKTFGRSPDLVLELDGATVQISDHYLEAIARELITNAFKFSAQGSPVKVMSAVDDDKFILSVVDRGQGISEEQIADLGAYMKFEEKLYAKQGSGLGLAIAQRLVELHEGSLAIESILYEQTTVTVTLPIAA
ncbi:response regulator [Tumidithrix helvetica PCC 7403]|uniref:hybrid sensor histidine kinase/response regulator n=1 Tax=Tumidithrix helvetica TaxID=3457545 RepID=UPI003C812159